MKNVILFIFTILVIQNSSYAEVEPFPQLQANELVGTWYALEGGSIITVLKLEIDSKFDARIFSSTPEYSSGMDYALKGKVTYDEGVLSISFSSKENTTYSEFELTGKAVDGLGKTIVLRENDGGRFLSKVTGFKNKTLKEITDHILESDSLFNRVK